MPRRIIPISSGKGGVGKTTIAVNFALALSRIAPTVLVDLDTGTSSVRNSLAAPVTHDLYHMKRHGTPLAQCITRLDAGWDPHGRFRNFGYVAGPRHFIEEIANPDPRFRRQLQKEINTLDVEYVVLDLRAGLDVNVLDFLPYTNSGVLVFTPQNPSATISAAEIVKAILFRSLRLLFGETSSFFDQPGMGRYRTLIHDLLDRVEDVYDPAIPNLDAFIAELREAFGGEHPILYVLAETLDAFRVHYVLNMFDGVEQSYDGAVAPFVRNLAENVSARLNLTQLGWVVHDRALHEANCAGVPPLLDIAQHGSDAPPQAPPDKVMAELASLESAFLGIRRAPPPRRTPQRPETAHPAWDGLSALDVLDGQLASLRSMFSDRSRDDVRDNFAYIAYRALSLMGPHMGDNEFGLRALVPPELMRSWYLRRQL